MRTIKFRGKRVDNGEWVYGLYIIRGWKAYILTNFYSNYGRPCGLEETPVLPLTVGQFIGLNDYKGKEIYEGDIVYDRGWKSNLKVFYDEEFGRFELGARNENEFITHLHSNKAEVIGNIHDNPELLESK